MQTPTLTTRASSGSRPSSLLAHVSNYTLGNALITLAGLVSFPILTRLLSVEEYGVMNLVATALALTVALGKLGMQHAALRFHAEVRVQQGAEGLLAHGSTVLFGMGAIGLIVALAWAGVSQLLPAAWWSDERVAPLFLFTAVLIIVRVVESALVNPLRAQERSGVLNVYFVVRRWAGLALLLGVLIAVQRDLWGFYAATIVAEVIAVVLLAAWVLRAEPVAVTAFSPPMFKSMVAFGLPMLAFEVSSIVLSMGDRYLLQNMAGAEALGTYAAAYNLCDYVRAAFLAALVAAAQPAYLRIWAENGAEAVSQFLQRFVHVYLMVAAFLVAVMSAIGTELLHLLASAKYASGAVVIPWVMSGLAFDSLVVILGAGLYIQKRTLAVAGLVAGATVINLGLNAWLIPRLGIQGAGIATTLSYGALLAMCALAGRRAVSLGLSPSSVIKFAAFGFLTHALLMKLVTPWESTTLTVRVLAGVVVYATLVLCFDKAGRDWLLARWRQLVGRLGAA